MRKLIIGAVLAAAAAALSPGASAQSGQAVTESPYVVEACRAGCFILKERSTSIYFGAVPSSYRICSRAAFAAEISVDGTIVRVANRDCSDVNGRAIVLMAGEVAVGRLPN